MTDTETRKEIADPRACGSPDSKLACAYLAAKRDGGFACLRRIIVGAGEDLGVNVDRILAGLKGNRKPTEEWPLCQNPIRRSPYWVSGGRKGGCVEAEDEEHAIEIARAAGCDGDLVAKPLPYPASPRLGTPHWNERFGATPSFCWRPTECQGRTSCPRSPSCVD